MGYNATTFNNKKMKGLAHHWNYIQETHAHLTF